MKALTISQPYATLIAAGQKFVENRHWSTEYRGPLAIHAGKGTQYVTADKLKAFQTGGIVAVAELVACVSMFEVRRNLCAGNGQAMIEGSTKRFGDVATHKYAEGPYCWILENVIATPLLASRGAQGLWNVPAHHESTLKRLRGE